MVTASSVLTVEGTGGLLTEPAPGAPGTLAGGWLDTGPSMLTGRLTHWLLAPGSSVASLAPAHTGHHASPAQSAASPTLGDLTTTSSPASLNSQSWEQSGQLSMSCHVMSCHVMS